MFGLGVGELLLILGLGVFLFGAKKIPDLARGMGEAVNEFKKARNADGDKNTKKS